MAGLLHWKHESVSPTLLEAAGVGEVSQFTFSPGNIELSLLTAFRQGQGHCAGSGSRALSGKEEWSSLTLPWHCDCDHYWCYGSWCQAAQGSKAHGAPRALEWYFYKNLGGSLCQSRGPWGQESSPVPKITQAPVGSVITWWFLLSHSFLVLRSISWVCTSPGWVAPQLQSSLFFPCPLAPLLDPNMVS